MTVKTQSIDTVTNILTRFRDYGDAVMIPWLLDNMEFRANMSVMPVIILTCVKSSARSQISISACYTRLEQRNRETVNSPFNLSFFSFLRTFHFDYTIEICLFRFSQWSSFFPIYNLQLNPLQTYELMMKDLTINGETRILCRFFPSTFDHVNAISSARSIIKPIKKRTGHIHTYIHIVHTYIYIYSRVRIRK